MFDWHFGATKTIRWIVADPELPGGKLALGEVTKVASEFTGSFHVAA